MAFIRFWKPFNSFKPNDVQLSRYELIKLEAINISWGQARRLIWLHYCANLFLTEKNIFVLLLPSLNNLCEICYFLPHKSLTGSSEKIMTLYVLRQNGRKKLPRRIADSSQQSPLDTMTEVSDWRMTTQLYQDDLRWMLKKEACFISS